MDILDRLREFESVKDYWGDREISKEAADEIELLRKDYALAWENHLLHEQIFVLTEAKIERLREENQRQKEKIMLINSMVQTEHEIIRVATWKEGE